MPDDEVLGFGRNDADALLRLIGAEGAEVRQFRHPEVQSNATGVYMIEFALTQDVQTPSGGGAKFAEASIRKVNYGATDIPGLESGSGCKVIVYDTMGCHFDEDESVDYTGRIGTAKWMQGLDANCNGSGDGMWCVDGLCCAE